MIKIDIFTLLSGVSAIVLMGFALGAILTDRRALIQEKRRRQTMEKMRNDMITLFILPDRLDCQLQEDIEDAMACWNKDQRDYDRGRLTAFRKIQLFMKGRI